MDDLSVSLKLYSEDEIVRLSVVNINNASTTDHGTPRIGGLMDARMGSTDRSILCQTCHIPHCAGHLGRIELPMRILLNGHIKYVVALLRCVCFCCSQPLCSDEIHHSILDISKGFDGLKALADYCRNKILECKSCKSPCVQYAETNKIFITKSLTSKSIEKMSKEEAEYHTRRFTPDEIYSIFEKIPSDFLNILGIDYEKSHPKNALTNMLLILPPTQRPTLRIADGGKGKGEDDMTVLYQDVIRAKIDLETKLKTSTIENANTWAIFQKLQLMVSCLVNNGLRKSVVIQGISSGSISAQRGSIRTMRDLEHRLKGKSGRLRGTLNAKRTDFSARTVIGIDMSKDIWKLGVPKTRMKILTIPEYVTDINLFDMQKRVIAGAYEDNGAVNILQPIQGQEPRIIFLGLMSLDLRTTLAADLRVGWIIERHLIEGDWVLFNRQPTLHKMNIQAFQIYPVPGLTFRLPLPDTRPFNADYDGDEMNLNVPQSIAASTECQELMSVPHNMISPSNLSAIIALVQESLVAWYRLTCRDRILTKDVFLQLLAQITYNPNSLNYNEMPNYSKEICIENIIIPIPAILKSPKGPRWTGKQILENLLPKSINVQKQVRNGDIQNTKHWTHDEEDIVIIRNGQLLNGRLCKATLGGGPSLVHQIWKDIGPWAAAKFVSDAQRIGNVWNQNDAMCIGIRDCLLDDETNKEMDDLVATAMGKADEIESMQYTDEVKEMRVSSLMQDVLRSAGSLVLNRMDNSTALATVVISGSKGNAMNLSQIMGVVGQQSISGKRVVHRKTRKGLRGLVCYSKNDTKPEAKGFIATSYIQGQTEAEFYHAMMAGREGIVATAIETATSGYNQRKMVKISEGQVVAYDRTIRISSNEIVSFHYGGDDYDATKIERIKTSFHRISNDSIKSMLLTNNEEPLQFEIDLCIQCRNFLQTLLSPSIPGEYASQVTLPFHPARINSLLRDIKNPNTDYGNTIMTREYHQTWLEKTLRGIAKFHSFLVPSTTTILDCFKNTKISKSWGKTAAIIALTWTSSFFIDSKVTVFQAQWLQSILYEKIQFALVAPGEAVGTIGATSIGEPSTQGALNTFHFSGIAEKSGTTGLKRFKELLGNAKCKDTCVASALVETEEEAERVLKHIKKVYLYKITDTFEICDSNSKSSVLSKREHAVLAWVRTWMTPFNTKLDKTIQQSLSKLQVTATENNNTFFIQIKLDKIRSIQEKVLPSDVRDKLRQLLLDTCFITSSEEFESDWFIRILPFPVDTFLRDIIFDSRAVCEALLDVLNTSVIIRGLNIVSETFHVQTNIDTVLPNGGIGTKQMRKFGSVGSDILAMSWMLKDPSKLWSNDINEVSQYLGIEAANQLNNTEFQRVLSFDSTYIDARHTMLLAETMSRSGTMAALNRHKMEELGSSLLSRASFEQTRRVLEDAAFFHRSDALTGSLERQIVGLPLRVGTGIVHVCNEETTSAEKQMSIAPLHKAEKDSEPWRANHSIAPLKQFSEPFKNDSLNICALSSDWNPNSSHITIESYIHDIKKYTEDCTLLIEKWIQNIYSGQHSEFRFIIDCQEHMFNAALKKCNQYLGWDNADEFTKIIQTKEIELQLSRENCFTIVNPTNAEFTGKSLRIHLQKIVDIHIPISIFTNQHKSSIQAYTIRHIPIPSEDIPSVLKPKSVKIRQRQVFIKDGWKFTFSKEWTASTNLLAESKQIVEQPSFKIKISAFSFEASHNQSYDLSKIILMKTISLLNE